MSKWHALPFSRGRLAAGCAAVWLTACAATAPVPEWKLRASAALDRATQAALSGESRRAQADYTEAFEQIARSGQLPVMARAYLLKCAVQAASLDFTICTEFEARRRDASAEDLAYAAYLQGTLSSAELSALLPQHRPFALLSPSSSVASATLLAALKAEPDPLTRLVAASVLLRTGRASPDVIAVAVETASVQGWRYPLPSWLKAQVVLANKSGNRALAEDAQRRLDVVLRKTPSP